MSKLVPINGNVILKPLEEDELTYGNIVLPNMEQQRTEIGEVVAVCPLYNHYTGETLPPDHTNLEVGMKVVIPPMSSQKITLEHEEYWVTGHGNITAIINEN